MKKIALAAICSALATGALADPTPAQLVRGQSCVAIAPLGWRVVDSRPEGDVLGVADAGMTLSAYYSIWGTSSNTIMFNPQLANPDLAVQANITSLIPGVQVSAPRPMPPDLRVVEWVSPSIHGMTLYRVVPLPGDPYGYVIAMRSAMTRIDLWDQEKGIAMAVAMDITCTVQFDPKPWGDTGSGKAKGKGNGYNAQLGTEWVHSKRTGTAYMASYVQDYKENGPDGPGYYSCTGINKDDCEKLEPGVSD